MARFLVVDDELNALSALRELLESDGHQVAAVSSAREASAALKASAFDVVIADLEIPHGQGGVVVKLTREHQPAACVFVATARRAPRGLEQACHVFEKPLDYERITRNVAACRADQGPAVRTGVAGNRARAMRLGARRRAGHVMDMPFGHWSSQVAAASHTRRQDSTQRTLQVEPAPQSA